MPNPCLPQHPASGGGVQPSLQRSLLGCLTIMKGVFVCRAKASAFLNELLSPPSLVSPRCMLLLPLWQNRCFHNVTRATPELFVGGGGHAAAPAMCGQGHASSAFWRTASGASESPWSAAMMTSAAVCGAWARSTSYSRWATAWEGGSGTPSPPPKKPGNWGRGVSRFRGW